MRVPITDYHCIDLPRSSAEARCSATLAAANHIPASKPDPSKIVPTKDVSITVKLPRFFHAVEAFEVTENGLTAFPCERLKGTAVLRLDAIESGRVFVLRSRINQ